MDFPFTLQQLQVFAAVASAGTVTAAARTLYLTQPAATQSIRELERRLGVPLFERVRNRLVLTPEGETFLGRALDLLELAGEAAASVREALGGTLRLGASTTIGNYLLPEPLGAFVGQHPAVRVELSVDNSRRIVAGVLAQETPSALIEGPCSHPDIVMERLLPDELVIVCHPAHAWAGRDDVAPGALAEGRFILREPGSGTRDVIEEVLGRHELRLQSGLVFGHTEAIKTAVEAGLGVSILSLAACRREVRAGLLAVARMDGITLDRWFHAIRLRGRRVPPLFQAFREWLGRFVGEAGTPAVSSPDATGPGGSR
ncbi:MAG: transcriptional regulator [Myxococcales bacterium]